MLRSSSRIVLWLVAACGESAPRSALLADPVAASGELRAACALTEQRCTRCHTLGRIVSASAMTRGQWEPIINRMRHMSSSGISQPDAEVIVHCLVELQ